MMISQANNPTVSIGREMGGIFPHGLLLPVQVMRYPI